MTKNKIIQFLETMFDVIIAILGLFLFVIGEVHSALLCWLLVSVNQIYRKLEK